MTTRIQTWKKQGSYKSFNTGKPMILVMNSKGQTVLDPLHTKKITMKYQVLKQLKTKNKRIALHDTLGEAKKTLADINATFRELSYVGQFPVYTDGKYIYSIQGLHTQFDIVLSLSKEELATYSK